MPEQPGFRPGIAGRLSEPARRGLLRGAAGLLILGVTISAASLVVGPELGSRPDGLPLSESHHLEADEREVLAESSDATFTNGVGQPLASGEIGTVLDILFRDVQLPLEADGAPKTDPMPAPTAPEAPPAPRNVLDPDEGRVVQTRLASLGFYEGDPSAPWGTQSRQALREFKVAHQLAGDDVWDEVTERVLFGAAQRRSERFVGVWAPNRNACSPLTNNRGLLPAVIKAEGAWAGDVSCSFKNGAREGETWKFRATCSGARKRWTANVKLAVAGDTLIWSSERGTQTYVRCPSSSG